MAEKKKETPIEKMMREMKAEGALLDAANKAEKDKKDAKAIEAVIKSGKTQ
jgi:hypothetical protein|tara:strand:+ start:10590 stop:10742 length:153 start_codon:yes stop_codon:yes gene_type:complete